MGRITIDNLSNSLKEYLAGLGLSEEQVEGIVERISGDLDNLATDDKDNLVDALNELVGKDVEIQREIGNLGGLATEAKGSLVDAINELFQNANNGKELIANAIGEPVSKDDTFSAMSNDINSLLAIFKTNMMNNGIAVEANDRFKSLIDKIATMAEEGSGKGIQFASGNLGNVSVPARSSLNVNVDIGFDPSYIFMFSKNYIHPSSGMGVCLSSVGNNTLETSGTYYSFNINSINSTGFTVSKTDSYSSSGLFYDTSWYAIGVGEEDTTLRDSLADILENKGMDVTEEDDMASLITKIDSIKVSNVPDWYTNGFFVNPEGVQLSSSRAYAAACTVKDSIYIMGGQTTTSSRSYSQYNDCYDIKNNKITAKNNLPAKMSQLFLSNVNDNIYCLGGYNGSRLSYNLFYNVEADTFTEKTKCPFTDSGRGYAGSAANGTDVYFVASGNHAVYDTVTETWTNKPTQNMTTYSYGMFTHVYENKVYTLTHSYVSPYVYIYVYDILTETWSTRDNPDKMSFNGYYGTSVLINDKIFVVAGHEAYTRANYYDITNNKISGQILTTEGGRTYQASSAHNGCMYLFGGSTYNSSSSVNSSVSAYIPSLR